MSADIHPFQGAILSASACELGEGPTFDPHTGTAWWFNIIGKQLHELHVESGEKRVHDLPFLGSVLARIDGERQLVCSDEGLFIRDAKTGAFTPYLQLEADKPGNRSNDGRVHPSGSLWIGTMGRKAEDRAGSIYHVRQGKVTRLYDGVSIPNAICFSPDGATGYYVDTRINRLMRVALDAATGLPTGEPAVLIDQNGKPGGMDGAVCDAEGRIWNARWGQAAVDCYAPDGNHLARHAVPARQPSCPAFFGADATRILVTTAREGMNEDVLKSDPQAGNLIDLGIAVKGRFEPDYLI